MVFFLLQIFFVLYLDSLVICCGEDLFWSCLFGVTKDSCAWFTIFSPILGKFCAITLLNMFSKFLNFYFFPFRYVDELDILSSKNVSKILCILFILSHFFLYFCLKVTFWKMFSNSDIFTSDLVCWSLQLHLYQLHLYL